MANYHFSIKCDKKSDGTKVSAADHCDYINRENSFKDYDKTKDNTASKNIEYINRENGFKTKTGCIYKNNKLPSWANNSAKAFFAAADKYENANRVRYREIEFALPNEFNLDQQKEIINAFINKHLSDKYYVYAIHHQKSSLTNQINKHVHIMFSERIIDKAEKEKERTAENFFKYPKRNAKTLDEKRNGGSKKDSRFSDKNRSKFLKVMRKDFADIQNTFLEKYNIADRVDHRSLKEQRRIALENDDIVLANILKRMPEKSLGPIKAADRVDHRSLKEQRRIALENDDIVLANILKRMPEKSLGPIKAADRNNIEVQELQKYRQYKYEYRALAHAANYIEKVNNEIIITDKINKNENNANYIIKSDGLKNNKDHEITDLKNVMLETLDNIKLLKSKIISTDAAQTIAKISLMSDDEKALWADLNAVQEEKNRWNAYKNSLKKPDDYQQEELNAYHQLVPELNKKIKKLDIEIKKLASDIKPINERLAKQKIKNIIQDKARKILIDDKLTLDELNKTNDLLANTVDKLQKSIYEFTTEAQEKDTFELSEVKNILLASYRKLKSEYENDSKIVEKLSKKVIYKQEAMQMAKDIYTKYEYKKIRQEKALLDKESLNIKKALFRLNEDKKAFAEKSKPHLWSSTATKNKYADEKNELFSRETRLNNEKSVLSKKYISLDNRKNKLDILCESPEGKEKINNIALGILRKNKTITDKIKSTTQKMNKSASRLKHAKTQLRAVNTRLQSDKDGKYQASAPPANNKNRNTGINIRPSIIADALVGEPTAISLVARLDSDNRNIIADWNMMSNTQKSVEKSKEVDKYL